MSKPISSFYDATKYLGQFIGQQEAFLRRTACMSPEMRITIAVLDTAKELFKEDLEITEMITEIEPLLQRLGYAKWQRDTVTDMALKKANPSETEKFGDEPTGNANPSKHDGDT